MSEKRKKQLMSPKKSKRGKRQSYVPDFIRRIKDRPICVSESLSSFHGSSNCLFFFDTFFLYYLQVLTGIIYLTLHSTFYFLLGRESFKGGIGCSSYFKGLHVPWGWWQTQSLPTSFFTEDFFENKKFLALMKKTILTENKKCSFKHELGDTKLDETDKYMVAFLKCVFSQFLAILF